MLNVVCGIRSTGRICAELAEKLEEKGHEVKIAYGRESVPEKYRKYAVKIGGKTDQRIHALRTRILDEHGLGSSHATRKFLQWADEYNPDLLWLHNIHGYYINFELLFGWIKNRPNMQVKWTLHDCWAFTGHCSYFTAAQCDKWREYCQHCAQKGAYPASWIKDNCSDNFQRKQLAFSGVKNMTLITPSQWLADLVKRSFLSEYPVEVCYNTIDTNIFKPTPSDFRKRYGLQNKKIILGVASVWDERKGLEDFLKLAHMLDERYAIVLVGLSKKQIEQMPKLIKNAKKNMSVCVGDKYESKRSAVNAAVIRTDKGVAVPEGVHNLYNEITDEKKIKGSSASVLGITRTSNSEELAKIYTAADVFVNPTHEDNFPTVNLEAIACGTYVITYLTGGSPETLLV